VKPTVCAWYTSIIYTGYCCLTHNLHVTRNITNVARNQRRESSIGIGDRGRGDLVRKNTKVIIIGGSHARGCAAEITHNLGETFKVTGGVKPGTRLKVITNTANKEIDKLTREGVVVVWGGVNDIRKYASNDDLKYISNFAEHSRLTNIVIMNAPHRYHLVTPSCVNSEVKVFNRKLLKRKKRFDHIEIIDVNLNREHFTQHGLHMNVAGKQLIAQRLANSIRRSRTRQTTPPISLKWKEHPTEISQEENEVEGKSDSVLDRKKIEL
jgi:hypothetical protein